MFTIWRRLATNVHLAEGSSVEPHNKIYIKNVCLLSRMDKGPALLSGYRGQLGDRDGKADQMTRRSGWWLILSSHTNGKTGPRWTVFQGQVVSIWSCGEKQGEFTGGEFDGGEQREGWRAAQSFPIIRLWIF